VTNSNVLFKTVMTARTSAETDHNGPGSHLGYTVLSVGYRSVMFIGLVRHAAVHYGN